MKISRRPVHQPRWTLILPRVLVVTVLGMLLSFAIFLLLGIVGLTAASWARGGHPNLSVAYRDIAFPCALVVGALVLIGASVIEIRHYRQSKALAQIEQSSV